MFALGAKRGPAAREIGSGTLNHRQTATAEERRSARSSVLMAASLDCDGGRLPVRVVNLSAHGALVQGDAMPGEDSAVTFRCSGVEAPGWMAWVRPPLAGINFDTPIEPRAIVQGAGTAAMVIKDNRKQDFRRPGFRGNQLSEEEQRIVEEWAREQERRSRE